MPHPVQIALDDGEFAALKLMSVARGTPMATIVKGALREHLGPLQIASAEKRIPKN